MSQQTAQVGQHIIAENLPDILPEFCKKTNVADSRLGAKALFVSNDFFAPKERILNPDTPVFIVGKFEDTGKWMDGWESRRKRHLGHDYVIIKLARPTKISGIDIDTSHFTGNFPSSASIDFLNGSTLENSVLENNALENNVSAKSDTENQLSQEHTQQHTEEQWDEQDWQPLVKMTPLQGHTHHFIEVDNEQLVTHVRLNIYPDGGVARLRIYGDIQLNAQSLDTQNNNPQNHTIDLIGALNGGRAIACNDAHFGAVENLLLPTKAPNMGEGWETRRRREPGNDWCIIALGQAGVVSNIDIDTAFFKGNFPDKVSIQAVYAPNTPEATLITQSMFWETLLEPQSLSADNVHSFNEIKTDQPITHIRMNIFPDGGISRIRLFGQVVAL